MKHLQVKGKDGRVQYESKKKGVLEEAGLSVKGWFKGWICFIFVIRCKNDTKKERKVGKRRKIRGKIQKKKQFVSIEWPPHD